MEPASDGHHYIQNTTKTWSLRRMAEEELLGPVNHAAGSVTHKCYGSVTFNICMQSWFYEG